MGKVSIIIRSHRKNSDGKCSIMVRYTHRDKSSFYSTSIALDPKGFDAKEEVVRKSVPCFTSINAILNKKKMEVAEIQMRLQLQDIEPTVDAVRTEFQKKYKPIEVVEEPQPVKYLLDHWGEFIKHQIEVTNLHKNTLVQYDGTRKKIIAFEEYQGRRFLITDLNKEWGERFVYFLTKIQKLSNNSVGARVKMIRAFMNYLLSKSLINDSSMKTVKKPGNKTDIVTLSIEQIAKLMEIDLSSSKKLERVRDLYCFNSNVGLRFGDLNGLTVANFKGDYVVVNTRKTNTFVRIPLNAMAKQILAKYPNGLPKISNVKFNAYIKEVGELAKLDDLFELNKFVAGERKKVLVPLKKLMTSHQCRRNFATNCLRLGMPPSLVQKLTGHASYQVFERYLYASDERIGEEFNKAWNNAPGI
jgi:site-specific recombinase XerD